MIDESAITLIIMGPNLDLITYNRDSTSYRLSVIDVGEEGIKQTGSRFWVAIYSPVNRTALINEEYKVPYHVSYIFQGVDGKDATNVADVLNWYFHKRFGDKIHAKPRIVQRDGRIEVTRD